MDCQSGCPLKSVNFAYFPGANLDSACPTQGSASMWALMEGPTRRKFTTLCCRMARDQQLPTPFLFISCMQPRYRMDANAKKERFD